MLTLVRTFTLTPAQKAARYDRLAALLEDTPLVLFTTNDDAQKLSDLARICEENPPITVTQLDGLYDGLPEFEVRGGADILARCTIVGATISTHEGTLLSDEARQVLDLVRAGRIGDDSP